MLPGFSSSSFSCFTACRNGETLYLAVLSCAIGVGSYIICVYVNALWLMPKFYRKKRKTRFFIYSMLFLAALIFFRMAVEYWLLYPYHKQWFYNFSLAQFSFCTITISLAFIAGAMLNTLDQYIDLQRRHDSMHLQQTAAELNPVESAGAAAFSFQHTQQYLLSRLYQKRPGSYGDRQAFQHHALLRG